MQIRVCADDGDQITINADNLATEQQIIRLEFSNLCFDEQEIESISLTTVRARELAAALLTTADAVDRCAIVESKLYHGPRRTSNFKPTLVEP